MNKKIISIFYPVQLFFNNFNGSKKEEKRLKMSLKDNGGIILPLNHYALGNSGGEGIFYAENGI